MVSTHKLISPSKAPFRWLLLLALSTFSHRWYYTRSECAQHRYKAFSCLLASCIQISTNFQLYMEPLAASIFLKEERVRRDMKERGCAQTSQVTQKIGRNLFGQSLGSSKFSFDLCDTQRFKSVSIWFAQIYTIFTFDESQLT